MSKITNRFRAMTFKTSNPVELVLEITNQCNLSCIMCPGAKSRKTKQPLGRMSFDLFRNIINQVKDYVELVYLSGGIGEPMTHPLLFDMIKFCKRSGLRVLVSTNATLLDSRNAYLLLESKADVLLLSLDAATKETYEKIRRGGNFEKVMSNIENFLEIKKEFPPLHTITQMVYMPINKHEKNLFIKKWRGKVDTVRIKNFYSLDGANYHPEVKIKKSCFFPRWRLTISYEGIVSMCCHDLQFREKVGDVKNTPISEIWNSERMQDYRRRIASANPPEICRNCFIYTNTLMRYGLIFFDSLTIWKLFPTLETIRVKEK